MAAAQGLWAGGFGVLYWDGRVNEFGWGGEGAAGALCQSPPAAVEVPRDSRVLRRHWRAFWEPPGTLAPRTRFPGTEKEHVHACLGCLLGWSFVMLTLLGWRCIFRFVYRDVYLGQEVPQNISWMGACISPMS